MNGLSDEQVAVLLKGIAPHRVHKDERGNASLEQWDVRAMLNRVFGFCGWTLTYETEQIYEDLTATLSGGGDAVDVAYRSKATLTLFSRDDTDRLIGASVYEGTAVGQWKMGTASRGDAHDAAIKTAESQAVKRAAINLGDQFGLGLYYNRDDSKLYRGPLHAAVKRVVGFDPPDEGEGS